MKHFYNILVLAFLLPLVAVASNEKFKGKHTMEKKVRKEFVVNANAGLAIDNKYGNVNIVTWDQNKTVIDVIIRTNGNNEDEVTERLEGITIDFKGNGSRVSATTRFEETKSKWRSWFGGGNSNVSIEVNYTIKLPVTNSVNIDNDYGVVSIDKLQGNAKISCDYGQLLLGDLMADDNYLNFDYTDNATIQYMKSGKINADYSGFTLQKADRLELNADHTDSEISEVSSLNYNNDYGKIKVGTVSNVIARGDHISHAFGTVRESLNVNTDYGSVTVNKLEKTSKKVIIMSKYSSITLGLANGYSFDVVLNLTYSNMKGESLFQFTNKRKERNDQFYSGYYGTKGSGNTVNINSTYGGITFKKL